MSSVAVLSSVEARSGEGPARADSAAPRSAEWERTVAELVDRRGDALLRYATLLCGDPEDGADLVQDALVATFGRLRNGHGIEKAEAYVRRAILNRCLDQWRGRGRWRKVAYLAAEPDSVPAGDGAVDTRLEVRRALAKLSPRERACVVLRYYEDLTVDGIAASLGISSGAVKRYLSDGLCKLGDVLGPVEGRRR